MVEEFFQGEVQMEIVKKVLVIFAILISSICFAGEVDINSANAETFAAEL